MTFFFKVFLVDAKLVFQEKKIKKEATEIPASTFMVFHYH